MANPDIKLLFGVQGDGSLSGASGAEIKKRLSEIVEALNRDPFKIKFTADTDSLKNIKQQIDAIQQAASSATTGGHSANGSNILRFDQLGITKALNQIQSLRMSIQSIIKTAKDNLRLDGMQSQLDAIGGNNGLLRALDDLEVRLQKENITSRSFAQSLGEIALSAKKSKEEINGIVADNNRILKDNPDKMVESLTKIQDLRRTIQSTLNKAESRSSLGGMQEQIDIISGNNGIISSLDALESRVQKSYITGKSFSSELKEISSSAKDAKQAIDKIISDNSQFVGSDGGRLDSALAKIDTLRNTIRSMEKDATANLHLDGMQKQYDALVGKYGLASALNDLEADVKGSNITKSDFASLFREIANAAKSAKEEIKQIKTDSAQIINNDPLKLTTALSKIQDLRRSMQSAENKAYANFGLDGMNEQLEVFIGQDGLVSSLNNLENELKQTGMTGSDFSKRMVEIGQATKTAKAEIDKIVSDGSQVLKNNPLKFASAESQLYDLRNSIQSTLAKATENISIPGMTQQLAALSGEGGLIASVDKLKASMEDSQTTTSGFSTSLTKVKLSAKQARDEIEKLISDFTKDQQAKGILVSGTKDFEAAAKQIDDLYSSIASAQNQFAGSKNSGIKAGFGELKSYGEQLDSLMIKLRDGELQQSEFNDAIRDIRGGVDTAISSMSSYGAVFDNLKSQLSGVMGIVTRYYSSYRLITAGINTVKDMVNQAIELDTAFADTRIVTHATAEELRAYSETIADVAQETSTSINDLVSATTTYARLGYSLDESTLLAKYTGMLEKVGDVDTQKAEDAVTAIIKAFPDDVDISSIEQAMDKLVKTGNNFPISVEQIAEGMTNASSAMSAAGNSFEETVALLTAANTTVQNASKASTALRTISARLRKTKTELDELGESMEESTYDKMVSALTQHNVSLTNIDNEYRSTFEIMQDIAAHWDEMTNMEQAALAEAIAGNRQQTVFYSIVENFREASGAMESMQNSSGALAQSYSVYIDTIEAHTTRFHTAWQQLAMDFVNSESIKGIVDLGTGLLNVVDKLQRVHLLVPSLIGLINGIKGLKLVASMNRVKNAASGFADELIKVGGANTVLTKRFLELTAAEQKEVVATVAAKAATGDAGAQATFTALQTEGLTTATNAQTAANERLAVSFKSIFASNPLGWIMMAVSLVPSIISLFSSFSDEAENTAISLSEITSSINDSASGYKEAKNKADQLIPRFAELASGVDQYGRNISLTDEAYNEFLDVQNQLVEIMPDLKSGIDENGNAMISLRGSAEQVTTALYEQLAIEKELARIKIVQDAKPLFGVLQYSKARSADSGKGILGAGTINIADIVGESLDDETKKTVDDINKKRKEMEDALAALDALRQMVADAATGKLRGDFSAYNSSDVQLGDLFNEGELETIFNVIQGDLSNIDTVNALIDNVIQGTKDAFYKAADYRAVMDPIRQSLYEWSRLSPEYANMADDMQQLVIRMISIIPDEYIEGKSEDEVHQYIQDKIITPLKDASPEVQAAINSIMSLNGSFVSGSIGAGEFTSRLEDAEEALKEAGLDADTLDMILSNADYSSTVDQIESVKRALEGAENDASAINSFLSDLSYDELTIAYDILTKNGSMTIDELIDAIERAKIAGAELVEVGNFGKLSEDLNKIVSSTDKLTSAMEKLRKGTALTKSEMAKLALQYPELLKQSNLFTDGSIEGQKKMLKFVLDSYETEYNANIDLKIKELEGSIEAVKAQKDLELKKAEVILQIQAKAMTRQLDGKVNLVNEIKDLNNLEAQNFVTLQDGIVKVNAKALNKMNGAEWDATQRADTAIWVPYSQSIADRHKQAAQNSIAAVAAYEASLTDMLWAWAADPMSDINLAVKAAKNGDLAGFIHNWYFDNLDRLSTQSYKNDGRTVEVADAKTTLVWAGEALNASGRRIIALDEAIEGLEDQIENLEALKGLKLDGLAIDDSSTSSSKSSSTEKTAEDWLKAAEDALDKFVQYRVKVIKDMRKQEKDDLKQRLSDLKDFYDKQKELLKKAREEEKYLDEQAEKRKTVADIRSQIEQLRFDNSAWAAKRTVELTEDLNNAEKELLEFEKDHALDSQLEMLDNEYERAAAEIQDAIDRIDASLNDPKALYNQALSDIQAGTKKIYDEMKAYADATGDGHTNEADKLYSALVDAANAYNANTGNAIPALISAVISSYSRGGYASGTSSATRGFHRVYENGAEAIFESSNGNKYKLFSGGEKVLNADATNFLYRFAEYGAKAISPSAFTGASTLNNYTSNPAVINLGDIIVNGNADERTVSEIRRAQRENVEMILREFNKLRH